ncbi:hypothetical protein [Methylocystis parvus]|uniref:hypothetical protein n=1 Tax=Methylocystis parvus TaxID=134 RepID=UPI001AEBE174|nr:hypothetical protein [Methylocystis parvus]
MTRETPQTDLYGRYQPKDDWRQLTDKELCCLVGDADREALQGAVQICRLPDALFKLARLRIESEVATGRNTTVARTGATELREPALSDIKNAVQDWIFAELCKTHPIGFRSFVRINPPGRNSSTGFRSRGWNGLHIDHWGGNVWLQMRRSYNGSRFIFNLGDEVRHFIFINLKLCAIATRHSDCVPKDVHAMLMDRDCPMQGLMANAFMEAYPDYPVARVSIPPGFGYIAATTEILHDGYLAGKEKSDIALLVQHEIPRDVAEAAGCAVAPLTYRDSWRDRCQRSVHA